MTLEDAIVLAVQAHRGQKDKAGQDYILHPLRLMVKMDAEVAMMAAVLHDVVEDPSFTFDDLRNEGCPDEVIGVLDRLTQRTGEEYADYIARVRTDPTARKIKFADLEDNLNVLRLSHVTPRDVERLNKYLEAWRALQDEPV